MSATLVARVDGSRAGWVYVVIDAASERIQACSVTPTFSELLLQATSCVVIGIDIPIGLPDQVERGGRSSDREARTLLRPTRHNSVFAVPPRPVLQARSFDEANELHRKHSLGGIGMSRQAYGLLPKIAEVDDLMTPRIQRRVMEVHPELRLEPTVRVVRRIDRGGAMQCEIGMTYVVDHAHDFGLGSLRIPLRLIRHLDQ